MGLYCLQRERRGIDCQKCRVLSTRYQLYTRNTQAPANFEVQNFIFFSVYQTLLEENIGIWQPPAFKKFWNFCTLQNIDENTTGVDYRLPGGENPGTQNLSIFYQKRETAATREGYRNPINHQSIHDVRKKEKVAKQLSCIELSSHHYHSEDTITTRRKSRKNVREDSTNQVSWQRPLSSREILQCNKKEHKGFLFSQENKEDVSINTMTKRYNYKGQRPSVKTPNLMYSTAISNKLCFTRTPRAKYV